MSQRSTRPLLLAAVALAALLVLAVPRAQAATPTVWLCNPTKASDPCRTSLTATKLTPAGARIGVERTVRDRRPAIDCFYVYPTVSGQPTPTATRAIDGEQRAIALYQASRFAQHCRVYAPVYRQLTLAGIADPSAVTPALRERAYRDVRDAWRSYLRRDNHGRGVVLIGHSQGTFMLRRLVAEEIDGRPSERRRLVSALLLGGNVTVARGRDVGGDFRHVRACRTARQLQCVVAYSTFGAVPPQGSRFGRVTGGDGERLEVLCTNPAALAGGSGILRTYDPSLSFPGALGAAIGLALGGLPQVDTPWLAFPNAYRARCQKADGASYLRVTPRRGAQPIRAVPDAGWGLHLTDVNIALGDLTALVGRQAAAYAARAARSS